MREGKKEGRGRKKGRERRKGEVRQGKAPKGSQVTGKILLSALAKKREIGEQGLKRGMKDKG